MVVAARGFLEAFLSPRGLGEHYSSWLSLIVSAAITSQLFTDLKGFPRLTLPLGRQTEDPAAECRMRRSVV